MIRRGVAPASVRSPQFDPNAKLEGYQFSPASSSTYHGSQVRSRAVQQPLTAQQEMKPVPLEATMSAQYGTGLDEEPSTDLNALLDLLTKLKRDRVRLTEVTYIINRWGIGPILFMKHHGFVIKCEGLGFLGLDFGRKGIMWDTYDEFPDLPDHVCFAKKYKIDTDPLKLKSYCEATKPFDWLQHDCAAWAAGLLKVMHVHVNESGSRRSESVDLLSGDCEKDMEGPQCGLPLGTVGHSCWSR